MSGNGKRRCSGGNTRLLEYAVLSIEYAVSQAITDTYLDYAAYCILHTVYKRMVYILVLSISFLGICLIIGGKILMRNRSVRRYVRSMQQRWHQAQEHGVTLEPKISITKNQKSPRVSAIEMQQVRSLVNSAEKAIAQQNTNEAERYYIQALTIQPDALEIQADLAKLYLKSNREAKAEAIYKELLQKKDDVSYFGNLGLAYYQQKKYINACKAFQEALNRDPHNPDRSSALGRACIAAGRYEDAAPLLEKACQRISRDTEMLHLLAECYLQIGDTASAEHAYRRINKLEPYDEEVKKKLSSLKKL